MLIISIVKIICYIYFMDYYSSFGIKCVFMKKYINYLNNLL